MQKTSLKRYSCLPTKVSPTSMGFMKKPGLAKLQYTNALFLKLLDAVQATGRYLFLTAS